MVLRSNANVSIICLELKLCYKYAKLISLSQIAVKVDALCACHYATKCCEYFLYEDTLGVICPSLLDFTAKCQESQVDPDSSDKKLQLRTRNPTKGHLMLPLDP